MGANSQLYPDVDSNAGQDINGVVQIVDGTQSNWDTKMKGQTMVASVYVPSTMVGQTINLTILNGCDSQAIDGTTGWQGNTYFYVQGQGIVTADTNCSAGNVYYSFTAPSTTNRVYDYGITYFRYNFIAYATGSESLPRYLNAFQVRATTAGVLMGIATQPVACNNGSYPLSCPSTSLSQPLGYPAATSYSYSSFLGDDNPSSMTVNLSVGCSGGTGQIYIYDLDGEDLTLNQNLQIEFLRDGATWLSSWSHATILANGGQNNQAIYLPNSSSTFTYTPGSLYQLRISGLNPNNALQVLTWFTPGAPTGTCGTTDAAPTLSAEFDCQARRWVIVTDDPNDPGPSDYPIEHVYRQYNYATSSWGSWTPVIATSPFYQYTPIAQIPGPADNIRYWDGGGYTAAHDFVYRQYRFRTQGRDGNAGTPPPYVYSNPDFPLMGRCVQATCNVSIPATTTWNTPFTATFTIRNTGMNDGRTWTEADNMDLEDSTGAVVANLVNGSPNGAPVIPTDTWVFTVQVTPPTVGANRSFTWNFVRGATTITSCTRTTNVRYAPPVAECAIPGLAFSEQGSTDNTVAMNGRYTGANTAPTGEITDATISTTGYSDSSPNTPALPDPVSRSNWQSLTFDDFRFPATTGQLPVNGSVTVFTIDGIGGPGFTDSVTCNTPMTVGNWPYLKSYGAEVWAGANFQSPCTNSTATIDTFAEPIGAGQYHGSSAQLTVTSLLNIVDTGTSRGFYSASARDGAATTVPPKGLTRANNVGAQTYGGGFGFAQCITDYYGTTSGVANPATDLPPFTGTIAPGIGIVRQRLAGGSTLATGNLAIPNGTQLALYVNGDLYINGNITFPSGGAATRSDMPYFALIVRGNIYIGNNVRRLDGLYVAQVNAAGGRGRLFTCASGLGTFFNGGLLYANCGGQAGATGVSGQLVFNGAVVADQVRLQRTFATLRQSTPDEHTLTNFAVGAGGFAAEVFNYTPEMYLAPSPLYNSSTTPGSILPGRYDAITSMPPVY